MGYYDIKTVNTAIENTLAEGVEAITPGLLKRSQDLDELSDNIPEVDMPLLQVVPASGSGANFSQTHNQSFGGQGTDSVVFKPKEWVFDAFVYVSTLSKIKVGMNRLATVAAAITEVLDAQDKAPLFGEEAIQSFTYTFERGNIDYSNVDLLVIRWSITCQIW